MPRPKPPEPCGALLSAADGRVRSAGVGAARATIDQTAASIGRVPTSIPAAMARLPGATAAIVRGASDLTGVAALGRVADAAAPVYAPSTAELRDGAGAAFEVTAAPIAREAAVVREPFARCRNARASVGGPDALAVDARFGRGARPTFEKVAAAVALLAAVEVRARLRDAQVVVTGGFARVHGRTPAAQGWAATAAERRGRAGAAISGDPAAAVARLPARPRRVGGAGLRRAVRAALGIGAAVAPRRAADADRERRRGRQRAARSPRYEALGRQGAHLEEGARPRLAVRRRVRVAAAHLARQTASGASTRRASIGGAAAARLLADQRDRTRVLACGSDHAVDRHEAAHLARAVSRAGAHDSGGAGFGGRASVARGGHRVGSHPLVRQDRAARAHDDRQHRDRAPHSRHDQTVAPQC